MSKDGLTACSNEGEKGIDSGEHDGECGMRNSEGEKDRRSKRTSSYLASGSRSGRRRRRKGKPWDTSRGNEVSRGRDVSRCREIGV